MLRAKFTARSSVPVTSIKTFTVFSVSLVSSPFIIGGIDSTLSSESVINGYLSNLFKSWAYFFPLLMIPPKSLWGSFSLLFQVQQMNILQDSQPCI